MFHPIVFFIKYHVTYEVSCMFSIPWEVDACSANSSGCWQDAVHSFSDSLQNINYKLRCQTWKWTSIFDSLLLIKSIFLQSCHGNNTKNKLLVSCHTWMALTVLMMPLSYKSGSQILLQQTSRPLLPLLALWKCWYLSRKWQEAKASLGHCPLLDIGHLLFYVQQQQYMDGDCPNVDPTHSTPIACIERDETLWCHIATKDDLLWRHLCQIFCCFEAKTNKENVSWGSAFAIISCVGNATKLCKPDLFMEAHSSACLKDEVDNQGCWKSDTCQQDTYASVTILNNAKVEPSHTIISMALASPMTGYCSMLC